MIEGDPRENVRHATALLGYLGKAVDSPKRALQVLLFAASLVKNSNGLTEDLSRGAAEAENYLRDVRNQLNTDKAREWLREVSAIGKLDG